ncbi:MAG: hypothetical protein PVH68_15380 [Armatimonadota bacterium]|jgi:hypothetical protein
MHVAVEEIAGYRGQEGSRITTPGGNYEERLTAPAGEGRLP